MEFMLVSLVFLEKVIKIWGFTVTFNNNIENAKIAVIGLGYVGLPLAVAFGRLYPTVGFDLNAERVARLSEGHDATGEVETDELRSATQLKISHHLNDIADCNVYIVAVPTPVDLSHQPNLGPLVSASELIGKVVSPNDVVIYESTVYPGATEEDCLPVVEKVSGLKYNKDFFAGYSPERINPGDKDRPLTKIVKVTSGSTPEVALFVDGLYASIIEAGTFCASSIRVAEASKVIENTQRDVNIALVNELSIVFSHMNIDTHEVIEAASTKWNFVKMSPGLVGGHCIGVDPYYLIHKSSQAGYIPDIIRQSRRINENMAHNIAGRLVKKMILSGCNVSGANVLVVGFTFKENCPDTRNTKVVDLVSELQDYSMKVDIVDTWADPAEVSEEYGISIATSFDVSKKYDAVILAVPHRDIVSHGAAYLRGFLKAGGVFFDIKAAFGLTESDLRL